jgi:hypothetical protein
MGKDEGNCPYCGAVNSYAVAACKNCGEELPWANWVQARQQPSSALGAEAGSFARPSGQDVTDGISILPRGAFSKLILVIVAIAIVYICATTLSTAVRRMSGGVSTTANSASNGTSGNIAEKFKQVNPSIEQDRREREQEKR